MNNINIYTRRKLCFRQLGLHYDKILNGKLVGTASYIPKNIQYDYIFPFVNKVAIIVNNYKYNFITKQGNLLSEIWFDLVTPFKNNLSKVMANKKYNIININGNLKFNCWYDYILSLGFNNFIVRLDNNLYSVDSLNNFSHIHTEHLNLLFK